MDLKSNQLHGALIIWRLVLKWLRREISISWRQFLRISFSRFRCMVLVSTVQDKGHLSVLQVNALQ